jgi:branched-subunit amino acid aminotransferase/4-amino-4-deoxychorismate lyase
MRLLKQVHEEFVHAPVNLEDLRHMRVAFATNVTIGIRAIGAIDEVNFSTDAPILNELRAEYEEIPGEEI